MTHLLLGIFLMLLLICGGTWISISIGLGGLYALFLKIGTRTLDLMGVLCWANASNFVLASIPLFVFMGEFLSISGIIERVYEGLNKLLAKVPGQLLQSNIGACAIFAAASGSSLAGSATMGKIAYTELVNKRSYDKRIVLGTIAAGGTLGTLIPPSIIMILYADVAEESVGQLFSGGVFPGLMLTAFFMIYIAIRAILNPRLMPQESVRISFKDRVKSLYDVMPFFILVGIVLGTIYSGLATPTEAAAAGATGSVVMSAAYRTLTWKKIVASALATVRTTCMIFLIVMAAKVMVMGLTYYGVSHAIEQWFIDIGSPTKIYLVVILIYLILGCFFDAVTMIVLTVPIFLPVMESFGYSRVWFGIVVTICMEMGLLTPPVGVNLFIMQGVTGESLEDVAKGSYPFLILMLVLLVIIWIWPPVATWLPTLFYR
jgi:tripartite ATP-independent transporter DctM subunit